MERVGFRGRTRRYAFLLFRARSGAGVDGATTTPATRMNDDGGGCEPRMRRGLPKLTNSLPLGRRADLSEAFLLDRPQQQRQFRGDDREQIMSARQAAEALFTPKPEVTEQPVSDPSQSAKARKPRVLPALPPTPIRQETVDAPATPEPATAPADVYRVPVETIERILQKA